MAAKLQKEFDFYLANQDWMVEQYDGKCVVIKDGEVLGAYDNELAAVTETQKHHPLGTFLVQRVSEGNEAYTVIVNSPGVRIP